ncbi:serine/threonine-protein kinase (plasmid) [Streptomyces sp. FXJ1.172]|uniref:serine/threonine-protein kinase n=1 Tax=Streptomyces sp. FXJ1.172 TaxID=710705 RepID=UPI002F42B9AF
MLAAGLAEALAAIHDAGLVHRDLKPANVLITDDGPRIIDFGIARSDTTDITLTTLGGILGTPGYMSPEQATGEVIGPASDVFSLGAVLYYAATGRGPFGQGTVPALLYQVVHDDPDLTPVPDALRPALTACFHKEPERRPNAANLLTLLENLEASEAELPQALRDAPRAQALMWWQQPTVTEPWSAPLPPAQPVHIAPPGEKPAWSSVGDTESDPVAPAFATGAQDVEECRAEQREAERGPAPGPRVDAVVVGDVVEHTRFGIGTVLEVQGTGRTAVAVVSFGARRNTVRLLIRQAPMRKVEA